MTDEQMPDADMLTWLPDGWHRKWNRDEDEGTQEKWESCELMRALAQARKELASANCAYACMKAAADGFIKELASERKSADGVRIQRDELLRQRDEALDKLEAVEKRCELAVHQMQQYLHASIDRTNERDEALAERDALQKKLDASMSATTIALEKLEAAENLLTKAREERDHIAVSCEHRETERDAITAEAVRMRRELAEASSNFDALSQQYLTRAQDAEIALASATDLGNTYIRENELVEATSPAGLKHVIGRLGMSLNALRAERDALDEEARRYKREVDARREAEDEWLATRADLDDRAQKAEAEVATLRAAIGTPEVYAGVVTEVVEAELEQCRRELAGERDRADVLGMEIVILNAERDALKGADDGNGCPWKALFYAELAQRKGAKAERDAILRRKQELALSHANQIVAISTLKAEVERLAAIRAWATSERPSMPQCHATGHDDRWCAHCVSMQDGVDHAQATVLRILDGPEAGEDADDAPSCFERFCGQGAETRDCPCNGWSRRHECAHFTADPQPESEDGE